MNDPSEAVTCALCPARTTGRLPYNPAGETWASSPSLMSVVLGGLRRYPAALNDGVPGLA